jgi:hypothetical protein
MAKTKDKTKAKARKDEPLDLATTEKALIEKYHERNIVKGSLKEAGTLKEFGNKRTIEIRCAGAGETGKGCKVTRRIATSDLHQVSMCPDCIRQVRLDRRKDARAKHKDANPRKTSKVNTNGTKASTGTKAKPKTKAPKPIREKVPASNTPDSEPLVKSHQATHAPTDTPDEFLEKQLAETED